MDERLRRRLEIRRSNAAVPHRNHAREAKTGQAPWDAEDWHDMVTGEEMSDIRDEISAGLAEVYLPEGVKIWLASRNRNLGGRSAQELIDSGRGEEVLAEVERLVGGAW